MYVCMYVVCMYVCMLMYVCMMYVCMYVCMHIHMYGLYATMCGALHGVDCNHNPRLFDAGLRLPQLRLQRSHELDVCLAGFELGHHVLYVQCMYVCCMHVCACMCSMLQYVPVYACVYVYMCVCMYVCAYTYICAYNMYVSK